MQKDLCKVGGNWFKTKEWSDKARQTGILVTVAKNGVPCSEIVINNYDIAQYNKMLKSLIEDVYHISIVPKQVKRCITISNLMPEYEQGVRRALAEYGRKNILYFEEGFENEIDVDLESLTIAYGDRFVQVLLTTGEGIGMPLEEFLLWYKGVDEPSPRILSEWSGIPRDSLEQVYQIIVGLFYVFLKEEPAK